ncbi:hypothetical protein GBAR_LOCUS13008, partial [Geodia barretti]
MLRIIWKFTLLWSMDLSQLSVKRQLKRAKLFEVQKIVRQIRIHQNKKGTDAQLQKSKRKVKRLEDVLDALKDLDLGSLAQELCLSLQESCELPSCRGLWRANFVDIDLVVLFQRLKSNRPGQRTRQKKWEVVFGEKAKHLAASKKRRKIRTDTVALLRCPGYRTILETRRMISSTPEKSASDFSLLAEDEANRTELQFSPSTDISSQEHASDSQTTNSRRPKHARTPRQPGNIDSFQKEIEKWEEFYDDMKTYLTDGSLTPRNRAGILRQADAFFLGLDGGMFFTKTLRDGTLTLKLPVVRSYEERMEVCKRIHVSTGEEGIHHRRDTMLELLGQQYYWRGQRRDVCQCNSLLPLSGGVAFSPPSNSLSVTNSPVFLQTTEIAQTRSASTPLIAATQKDVVVRGSATATLHKSGKKPRALPVTLNSAVALVDPLANLYTIAEACLLNSPEITASSSTVLPQPSRANPEMSVASEVTVSDSSGLQIFTTINEPYFESHKETASSGPQSVSAVAVDQQTAIESMQMALKNTADPCQLSQIAGQSLSSVFALPSSTSLAVVCPSRGAAYLTSLSSILAHQGLLNPRLPTGTTPIVLHDTICENGSPSVFSSFLGASNWNLGTHTVPMDREILQATVSSNRVAAVLYRPLAYPPNTSFLCLRDIHSVCNPHGVSIILDCSIAAGDTLPHLRGTIKKMLTTGADLIMLPNTEHFQGPAHTCVVIGRTSLLTGCWERLSLLQPSLPLPLFCSAYDTVGSVVAFKSLQ